MSIDADYTPSDEWTPTASVLVRITPPGSEDCSSPTITASKVSLTASKGSSVTVGSSDIAANYDQFEITLNTAKENTLRSQTPPRQVVVQSGGITCSSSSNTAKLTGNLTNNNDSTAPSISSAVYGVSGSTAYVTVEFDEDTLPVNHAKVYLVNSTYHEESFASSKISHTTHTNSSKITLTTAQKNWFDLSDPPEVRITANGITDIWGNANSDVNVTSSITIPDALSATIDSASYNSYDKSISVSTSITLKALDSSKIKIKAKSGSTISAGTVSDPDGSSSFTITLTDADVTKLEKQTPPRHIEIAAGGITDETGTKNPLKITGSLSNSDDSTAPSISSAVYGVSGSTAYVTVTFDEDTLPVNYAKVYMVNSTDHEISFASGKISHTTHTNSSKITLTAAQKKWFDLSNPPDVRITANGITDIWGNANSDGNVTSTVTVPEAFRAAINSASYNPTEKSISVSTSLTLTAVDSSKMKLKAKSGSAISVTNATDLSGSDFKIYLTDSQNRNFERQTPPRQIEIAAGGITDYNSVKNVVVMTGDISNSDDTTYPSISSAVYGVSGSTASVTVEFDEDTLPVNHAKVYLVNSTHHEESFASGKISHTTHTNSSKITLTAAQKNWFDLSDPPEVRITANGITDIWGNANSDGNVTSSISVPEAYATTITSARYDPATRGLDVDLSNYAKQIDASKIKLKAKSGSTISVSSSQLDATSDTSYFTITLSTSQAQTFKSQTPPRSVEILAGGITDNSDVKSISAIDRTISYSDTSAPSISVANYTGGTIKATFSEAALSLNASKVSITAKSGDAVLLGSSQISHTARQDHLSITLNSTQKASYTAQTPPRYLTIQPNGVSDIWGNQNSGKTSGTILYLDDTTPPGITSAKYDITKRILNVTLSEKAAALAHSAVSITASAGNPVAPTSTQLSHPTHTSYFTITLDSAGAAKVEAQTHPRQVSVAASKLTDIWGNSNSGALTYAITYTGDTAAPKISSAVYNTAAGTLAVTLDEASLPVTQSKVRLADSAKSMGVNSVSHTSHTSSITITLNDTEKAKFRAYTPPRNVQVLAGGLTDLWNNAVQSTVSGAISYTGDTTPPGILSATYNTDTKRLIVILNEDAVEVKHDKMTLNASDASQINNIGSSQITHASHSDRFIIQLSGTQHTTFVGMPATRTITIDTGGVADVWSNANSAQIVSPQIRTEDNKPLAVKSSEYGVDTGVLNITLSKSLKSYDSTKILVGDASANMTFQAGAFSRLSSEAVTTTLTGSAKSTFEQMSHPRNVFVLAGGATDIWGAKNPDLKHAISYDDDAEPTLASSSYATASGKLTLAFSEHLASYAPAKITLYDSSKTGNVTLGSSTFTQNPSGTISTTLGGPAKGQFEDLAHPRHVAVLKGGVSDRWNNQNAAEISGAISDDDSAAPTLTSASYSTSTGVVTVVLSERMASHDPADVVLYDSSKTGNVTLGSNTLTQSPHGTLTTTLSGSQKSSFAGLDHPRSLGILPGGVTDIWNNANGAHLNTAFSYSDPNIMSVTSAEYGVGTGILTVTVSEDILRYDHAKIILKDSSKSVALGSADFAESTPGVLTLTLNSTKKAAFEGLSHPRNVTIQAGGVVDIWNRANQKPLTNPIQYKDTVKPAINSATYGTGTGLLNVTFPESLARYDHTRIILRDSSVNVTVGSGALSQHSHGVLTIKLSGSTKGQFEDLTHPRNVTVLAGGVSDIWNGSNAAALTSHVSYDDSAAPALNQASYSTALGRIAITLSERVASHDPAKVVLYDSTKTGNLTMSASMSQNPHGTLTATLSNAQKSSLASLSNPRYLAILPGGVTDIWNNTNGASLSATVTYSDPNTMSIASAEYGVGTGILTVTVSEDILRYDHTKIILKDSSKSVALGSADFAESTPGVLTLTLNSTKKAAFEGLSHPRNVTIQAGGVVDIWNRANQKPLTLTASYDETTPPTLSSTKYSSTTGVLTLTLSEMLDLPDTSNVILYDKSKSGNLTVSLGGASQATAGVLAVTLTGNTKQSFEDSLDHPRSAAILPDNVADIWNNTNKATLTSDILPASSAAPSLGSATYDPSTGSLKLGFSENLASYNVSGIILYNSAKTANITFGSADITEKVAGALNATLSSQQKTAFKNWIHPRNVVVLTGAVTDIWNATNSADITRAISYPTVSSPTVSSAKLVADNGTLTVGLSAQLESSRHNMPGIIVRATSIPGNPTDTYPLNNSMIVVNGSNYIKIDLSKNSTIHNFASKIDPLNLVFSTGSVWGIWNNPLQSIWFHQTTTVDSTPTLESATYIKGNGTLYLKFSEHMDASTLDASKIKIHHANDARRGYSPTSAPVTHDSGLFTFVIPPNDRATIDAYFPPRLDVKQGAVSDTSGNKIPAYSAYSISIPDAELPKVTSAHYQHDTGVISFGFDKYLKSADGSKIVLHDSTGIGNVTFGSDTFQITGSYVNSISTTMGGAQKTMFEDLGYPRNATIQADGAVDLWNNGVEHTTRVITSSDKQPPSLQSAAYETATGVLNLTLSEDLSGSDSTKVVLYDSTKSGNVTFAANTFSEVEEGILSATLSGSKKSGFADLNHPRNVAILAGGVTDIWNNANTASLTSAISDDDAAAPTLSSANYEVSTGVLKVTLSEDLAAHDSTKIVLYDSTKSGNVTFAANTFSESSAGVLSVTLSGSKKSGFEDLNHPRNVAILVGGVTDIWNNANTANLTSAISDDDAAAPTLSSANYEVSTGVLNVTLSEDLSGSDSTKVVLYDSTKSGNVTFTANTFSEVADGILSVTLSGSAKSGFEDLNHPRNVAILVGGVTDLWGNSNAASMNTAISDDDATAPTISSTQYKVSTGVLSLTLSEDLAAHDSTKIVLYDSTKSGNVTFTANTFSESSAGVLSVTLSGSKKSGFEDLNHPRNVAILVGGVTDLWGNSNAANMTSTISDDDDAAPTISSAKYDVSAGVLNVTLSEDLAAHDSAKIVLYDSTKSGNVTFAANAFSEVADGILSVTLSGNKKSGFEDLNHPRNVAILVGGVTDLWGNSNAALLKAAFSYDIDMDASISSANYKVSTGVLNVTLSEDLAAHDSTKISTVRLDKIGQRHLRGKCVQRGGRRHPLGYIERERKVRLRGPEPPQKCRNTGRGHN